MLYFSEKWDVQDYADAPGDLNGGYQIVSAGRDGAPYVLAYAWGTKGYNFQIFRCKGVELRDLAEFPEDIDQAESEQKAVDLLNGTGDAGIVDVLSDLAEGVFSNGDVLASATATEPGLFPLGHHKFIQHFLQKRLRELVSG